MNFEDLKEQLKNRLESLWAQIQESSIYITLKERFEALPARNQKIVILGTSVFAVLMILSLPFSSIRSSFEQEEEANEKRQLTSELLRTQRSSAGPMIPPPMLASALESRSKSVLESAGVSPEQIASARPLTGRSSSPLISKSLDIQGLKLSINKINLKQIIDIGHRLSTLNRYVTLKDLSISPNKEDQKYSNATFTLIAMGVIAKPSNEKDSSRRRSRSDRRTKRRGR